jgi:hypothetical protein
MFYEIAPNSKKRWNTSYIYKIIDNTLYFLCSVYKTEQKYGSIISLSDFSPLTLGYIIRMQSIDSSFIKRNSLYIKQFLYQSLGNPNATFTE